MNICAQQSRQRQGRPKLIITLVLEHPALPPPCIPIFVKGRSSSSIFARSSKAMAGQERVSPTKVRLRPIPPDRLKRPLRAPVLSTASAPPPEKKPGGQGPPHSGEVEVQEPSTVGEAAAVTQPPPAHLPQACDGVHAQHHFAFGNDGGSDAASPPSKATASIECALPSRPNQSGRQSLELDVSNLSLEQEQNQSVRANETLSELLNVTCHSAHRLAQVVEAMHVVVAEHDDLAAESFQWEESVDGERGTLPREGRALDKNKKLLENQRLRLLVERQVAIARCRANDEENARLKGIIKNCEAECQAWASLYQTVSDARTEEGQEVNMAAGRRARQGDDGALALFGTISRLISAEEQAEASAFGAESKATRCAGLARNFRVDAKPRDWLHWKDREAALQQTIREQEAEMKEVRLANKRLEVALARAESEREATEVERAEERDREREQYLEMEAELRTIQTQFRLLQRKGQRKADDEQGAGASVSWNSPRHNQGQKAPRAKREK